MARQVKVVLSTVLSGLNMRVLVNDGLEPVTEEMVTLASLLDKRVLPLSQVTSVSPIETSVSVSELMEMVQVRVRGAIRPAKRGPEGTVMTTSGVETKEELHKQSGVKKLSMLYGLVHLTLNKKCFHSGAHQLCLKSWRVQSSITAIPAIVGCSQ